ncbi:MAG: hypothetical protein AAF088_03305 [Pseudomonadota bacterium]
MTLQTHNFPSDRVKSKSVIGSYRANVMSDVSARLNAVEDANSIGASSNCDTGSSSSCGCGNCDSGSCSC